MGILAMYPHVKAVGLVSPSATPTCGWLTHGRLLFFARAKKSNQKKHAPVASPLANTARGPLRASPRPGARLTRRALGNAPRARSKGSRLLPALLGARLAPTGFKAPISILGTGVFSAPYGAPKHRSPNRGGHAPRVRARGALFAPGELRRVPIRARSAGGIRAIRARFLLGTFLCASKEKYLARGARTAITNTRPKAARPY